MRVNLSLAALGRGLHLYLGAEHVRTDQPADAPPLPAAPESLGAGTGLWADLDGQDDAGELGKLPLRHPSRFGFNPVGDRDV